MTLSITTLFIEWHFAECRHVEYSNLFIVVLNVIMHSGIILNVFMLSVIMPNVVVPFCPVG
jgi:hypothetical protein